MYSAIQGSIRVYSGIAGSTRLYSYRLGYTRAARLHRSGDENRTPHRTSCSKRTGTESGPGHCWSNSQPGPGTIRTVPGCSEPRCHSRGLRIDTGRSVTAQPGWGALSAAAAPAASRWSVVVWSRSRDMYQVQVRPAHLSTPGTVRSAMITCSSVCVLYVYLVLNLTQTQRLKNVRFWTCLSKNRFLVQSLYSPLTINISIYF